MSLILLFYRCIWEHAQLGNKRLIMEYISSDRWHRSLKAIVGNENWSESRPFSLFNSIPIKTPATAKIKAKTIVIAVTTPLWSGGGSNSCIAVGLLPTSEIILGWLVSAFFVIIELNSLWALLVTVQNVLVINDQRNRDSMIHVPCHLGGF